MPSQPSAEDRLIARIFKPIARHPGALGLVDDAAILSLRPGHELVLTTDAVIVGVHVFADDPADAIARKALRMNLSDLAGKGAKPAGFLLSIGLPKSVSNAWLKAFARGLAADARRYGCPLLGGDTDRTPGPPTVTIAAFGTLPSGTMVRRTGARVGDHVVVSGTIGDSALGLKLRTDKRAARRWKLAPRMRKHLAARYLLPQPRNALAEVVRVHASAAMDVSDGLAGDLAKLCRVSRVSADIDVSAVPLSAAARAVIAADPAQLVTALSGGDDYEIIATVPPRKLAAMQILARKAGVPFTVIGRVVKGKGARFVRPDGRALQFSRASYSHF